MPNAHSEAATKKISIIGVPIAVADWR